MDKSGGFFFPPPYFSQNAVAAVERLCSILFALEWKISI
jgi:hypothetical protein